MIFSLIFLTFFKGQIDFCIKRIPMPSLTAKGSRVWANIGPLQEGSASRPNLSSGTIARKRKPRWTRIRLHRTVIQSCGSPPNNLWHVYWDECGKTSDHRPVTLHIDNGAT